MVRRKGEIPFDSFVNESESRQPDERDDVPSTFKPDWALRLNVSSEFNFNEELLKCYYQVSKIDRREFKAKYGDLKRLMKVPVQPEGLRALVRFWDPVYRVFSLGKIDVSPTIEETNAISGLIV